MKTYIPYLYLTCCIAHPLMGGSIGAQTFDVQATVTTSDGTSLNLDKTTINGSSKLTVYAKPANITAPNTTEALLITDPRLNSVGDLQLNTIKSIVLKNSQKDYLYKEEKTNNKGEPILIQEAFSEIEIDGKAYLIPKNWKLHGIDENGNKRSIEFRIIEKIIITGSRLASNNCICPTQS